MDRQTTSQQLTLAERHVAEGERRLARQRELIAELDRDGHDTKRARMILATMQDTQVLHCEDRARLRRMLEQ
jgi:hypothetical protein